VPVEGDAIGWWERTALERDVYCEGFAQVSGNADHQSARLPAWAGAGRVNAGSDIFPVWQE
jgi:hypothetical protein